MLASRERVVTIHSDLDVDVVKLVEVCEFILRGADEIHTTEFKTCPLQLLRSRQASVKGILSMRMFVDSKMHGVRCRLNTLFCG